MRRLYVFITILLLAGFVLTGFSNNLAYGKYPEKMITYIVVFAAGGGTDRWARIMSSSAIDHFGQPWHVVNIPGASGVVGWKEGLNRPPDGYTMIQGSSTPVLSLLMEEKPPISPFEIKIVCYVSAFRSIIASQPDKPWANWDGFKDYAKKNPGKITLGATLSNIVGSANLIEQAGLKVTYVPYSSTGDAIADFLGGHIHAMAGTASSLVPLIPQKAVAVVNTSYIPISEKVKEFKGVPSAKDLGYEGMAFPRWIGVHPDTPDEIAKFMSEKFDSLLKDKAVVNFIKKLGEEINFMPIEEAQKDYKKMVEAMKKATKLVK